MSGKIDVLHRLPPMVARTRNEPKPRSRPAARSPISPETPAGRLTKIQVSALRASHIHNSASKVMTTTSASHAGPAIVRDGRLGRRDQPYHGEPGPGAPPGSGAGARDPWS